MDTLPFYIHPPSYKWYATCEICWEPCDNNDGIIGRWRHRQKWGHNPKPIGPPAKYPKETEREYRIRRLTQED